MRNIEKMLGEALGDPHEVLKSRAFHHSVSFFSIFKHFSSALETVLLSFDLNLDTKIFVANLLLSKIKLSILILTAVQEFIKPFTF